MRQTVMVDFRNLFSISEVKGSGMAYHSIGRASVLPSRVHNLTGITITRKYWTA